MVAILVPIFVCVVLPVCIVGIYYASTAYSAKKRSEVLIKAIEANNNIDTDRLAEILGDEGKKSKTPAEQLAGRLLRGTTFSLIGLVLIALSIGNMCTGVDFQSDSAFIPMLAGGVSLAIGIAFLVVYFATRRQVPDSSDQD